jgi:hypothetical protein
VVFSATWAVRRWKAVRILTTLQATGKLYIDWEQPSWARSINRKWAMLLPGARLTNVQLYGDAGGEEVAWAIRAWGLPQSIKVSYVKPEAPEAKACLRALGRLSTVKVLALTGTHLTDEEMARLLEQFPKLETLSLSKTNYSGSHFPAHATLRSVDFADLPFADESLAAVLRCPALQSVILNRTMVTPAGVRQMPQLRKQPLKVFLLFYVRPPPRIPPQRPGELTDEEGKELEQLLLQAWPGLETRMRPTFDLN